MVYTYVLEGEKTFFMLWAYVSVFLHSVLFGGTFKLCLWLKQSIDICVKKRREHVFDLKISLTCSSRWLVKISSALRDIIGYQCDHLLYSLCSIILNLTVYLSSDYRPLNTTLIINNGDSSVILNQTFTITCDTQANPQLRMRSSGMMVIKLVVIPWLQRQSQKWKGIIQWPSRANHLMHMEADRRQKLPWKCNVSLTASSRCVRSVRCVALLIYKYACTLYWYYETSVHLCFSFFPFFSCSLNSIFFVWSDEWCIGRKSTDFFPAWHS